MKHIYSFLLPFIIALAGCTSEHNQKSDIPTEKKTVVTQQDLVVDLNKATASIIEILKKGNISAILAPEAQQSKELTETLLKNFSPVEIAFEAEVLNFKDPVMLLFYDKNDPHAPFMLEMFTSLAQQYYAKSKFVTVEVSSLFKIAEQAGIEQPTLLLMNKRSEVGRATNLEPVLMERDYNDLIQKIPLHN